MNMESQTTSLEHSKRLKELGVHIKSLFWWRRWIPVKGSTYKTPEWSLSLYQGNSVDYEFLPAFTASELMELLPNRITVTENEPFNSFRLNIMKSIHVKNMDDPINLNISDLYIVNYECDSTECFGEDAWLRRNMTNNIADEKITDCLAKMMIYIIENKLMK